MKTTSRQVTRLSECPRIIVVQTGARRNYAVPAAFERYGMLEALYTDLCGTRGLGRVALHLARLPLPIRAQLTALGARRPPSEVAAKTRTFDWAGLRLSLANRSEFAADARHSEQLFKDVLGEAMVRTGYGNATHVYSMLGEAGTFLLEAKRRGLRIVSEVYIALSADNILRAERRAFPMWSAPPRQGSLDPVSPRFANEIMLTASDFFVCPSEFVRDDLVVSAGVAREKTVVVPYLAGEEWFDVENRPEPGRILFAGTADLRKGIHYLAMAAERLNKWKRQYRFRIAGYAAPEVLGQPMCVNFEFLGRVPRTLIVSEFAAADIVVLPSLAEGSASVTYEALAAGVPVVTTKAAGSVVRDGIDGLIVPERDPDALAEAIQSIIEDRTQRRQMAVAGRERAREYTIDMLSERLVRQLGLVD